MATLTPLDAAKIVVIKIGSALLVDREKHALDREWLMGLAEDVCKLKSMGKDVILVSSGSIALGREILELTSKSLSLEESQAAASVGQIALAQAYSEVLAPYGIKTGQVLLTSEDGENRRRYLNTQATLSTLLRLGVVPIINENDTVATDEIRFGDNDRLAAQLSVMARADVLILLSDVDGVYTSNPKTDPNATHIPKITEITAEIEAMAQGAGSEFAKGGMATKLMAAKTAMSGGVSMAIARGDILRPIGALMDGAAVSWFVPQSDHDHARKNWIRAMKTRGVVDIDQGALRALQQGSSLLAAGCRAVEGEFHRGDAVDVRLDGLVVARGLVAYDYEEAALILGAKSEEFEAKLGYLGRGAVIHRDNMVMLSTQRNG